jgi:hypothetical protein
VSCDAALAGIVSNPEIGAATLSPSAFAFYVLILVVVAIFWFA